MIRTRVMVLGAMNIVVTIVFFTHQLQIVFFVSYGLTALLLIDFNKRVSNACFSMLIISFF